MQQMSVPQARVIDPVLSTVAQGYSNKEMVGYVLFPRVPVKQRGGKIVTFGKEDFRLYSTLRGPGANTRRVQFGYSGSNYVLESHGLEGVLPIEDMQEANAVPGIDLGSVTVAKTQNIIALRLEVAQATLAFNAANYGASNKVTLSGTSQWSDYGTTSNPVKDVGNAREAVRTQIGRDPNTLVLGAAVFAALSDHPVVIDRIKYTGRDVATEELLAKLFKVERVVVGKAVYIDDAGTQRDVWGKSAVLAYTNTASVMERGAPSYGYTYQLEQYPMVEQPYLDRNPKSWIYPVNDECAPVIAGAAAGYLISGVVA